VFTVFFFDWRVLQPGSPPALGATLNVHINVPYFHIAQFLRKSPAQRSLEGENLQHIIYAVIRYLINGFS